MNKLLRDWQRRKWLKLERGALVILAPMALARVVPTRRNKINRLAAD